MGPKLLGGGASLLAVVFILALPTIFKGEPADEVEPIEFGPPPVARLAEAVRATANATAPKTLVPGPPALTPSAVFSATVASAGDGNGGQTASAAAGQDVFAEDAQEEEEEKEEEEEEEGGAADEDEPVSGGGEDESAGGGDDAGEDDDAGGGEGDDGGDD